jgi:hypothetical protein
MQTCKFQKTKKQLAAHGNYPSTVNFGTNFPWYFEGYLEFLRGI